MNLETAQKSGKLVLHIKAEQTTRGLGIIVVDRSHLHGAAGTYEFVVWTLGLEDECMHGDYFHDENPLDPLAKAVQRAVERAGYNADHLVD